MADRPHLSVGRQPACCTGPMAMDGAQAAEPLPDAGPGLRTLDVHELLEPSELRGNTRPPES